MSRITTLRFLVVLSGLGVFLLPWPSGGERTTVEANQDRQATAQKVPVFKGPAGLPMTGKALAALAPMDAGVEKIMLRHGIPGAAVAVTRNGKLIMARG